MPDMQLELDGLSERDRHIVALHVEHRKLITEVAETVGLSRQRTTQIIRRAGVPHEVTAQVRKERHKASLPTFVCENCGEEMKLPPSEAEDRRFCSPECHDAYRMLSDEDLLDTLRDLAAKLGRTPTIYDVNELTPHSHPIYYRRFGSFRKAQRRAGLKPNKLGGNRT